MPARLGETRVSETPLNCLLAALGACALALGAQGACADELSTMAPHDHAASQKTAMSSVQYTVPDIKLVRDDGKSISLPAEMNDGRPVMLNFIFTSCGSICPLMSQIFSQVQHRLGAESDKVHMMSISIDPEQDTPERLREYAKGFDAGSGWQHYTGTAEASIAAQRAFDVYRGDRMSHTPVTLLRAAPGSPWRRIDGFVTPDQVLREYRQLLASK
jgi:protein SCO1/2